MAGRSDRNERARASRGIGVSWRVLHLRQHPPGRRVAGRSSFLPVSCARVAYYTRLPCSTSSSLRPLLHCSSPLRRARSASTTSTPATPPRSASASTGSCSSRCPCPATRIAPLDETNLGQVPLRGARPRHQPAPLLARLRLHLRRVGDHAPRRSKRQPHLPRVAALPRAGASRCRWSSRSATRDNAFREVWSLVVDPEDMFVDARGRPRPGRSSRSSRAAPGGEGRPAPPRRRLHRRTSARKFEKDARRLVDVLFSTSPFKERGAATSTSGGSARPPRESGISRPLTGVHRRSPRGRHLRRLRLERYVLTFENRALPRRRLLRALRRARDPRERQHLRRRRHLQPLQHRGRRQPPGPPYVFVHEFGHHFAGARRRVLHLRVRLPPGGGAPRALGAERHRAPDPRRSKWKDLVSPGTPLPTPWQKEAFDEASREVPGAAQADPRREPPRVRDGRALPRQQQTGGDALLAAAAARRQGRRLRGRHVRGRAATTARRWTASCSPGTTCPSAPCAGAASGA